MYDGPNPHTATCSGSSVLNPTSNGCFKYSPDGQNTVLRYCENINNFDAPGLRGGYFGIRGVMVDDGQCTGDAYNFPQQALYQSCNSFNTLYNNDGARPQGCFFAFKGAASTAAASFGLLALLAAAVLALH